MQVIPIRTIAYEAWPSLLVTGPSSGGASTEDRALTSVYSLAELAEYGT